MRTLLLGLMMVLGTAACGDSSDDDNKNDDGSADAGDGITDVGDAGKLPETDDDLDDCDKGDPCCINSDEYDFSRCNPIKDAGAEDAGTPEE